MNPRTVPGAATIRAVVQDRYGDSSTWRVADLPHPVPGRGRVLVSVAAAGIDRGTWHVMTGLPRLARLGLGLRRPRRRVPGLDVAGRVLALGPDVSGLEVGDLVLGVAEGSLAEVAVARAQKLVRVPPGCSLLQASVLAISGLTALQAVEAARVSAGDRVLVLGASGGVGHYLVQMAVARGAVVTGVCGAAKADAVRSWGATTVLDHAHDDVMRRGERFDAVLDVAGGRPVGALRRLLSPGGTLVFVGDETGGPWTGGFVTRPLHALRFLGSRQRYVMLVSREDAASLARLVALVADGSVAPSVSATYPLDRAAEAVDDLAAGRAVGKLAVVVSSSLLA